MKKNFYALSLKKQKSALRQRLTKKGKKMGDEETTLVRSNILKCGHIYIIYI